MKNMSYKEKTLLAREFRKNMTPSEKTLWIFLRRKSILGYSFRRQFLIAGFIIDFYCPKLKLGIEVDGDIHNEKNNQIHDKNRELILKQYGITILRIKNHEIQNNLPNIIDRIQNYIKNNFPPRPPLADEEGQGWS